MNINNLTFLFGKMDTLFKTFLILIIIDYITGICKSIYQKKLSSKISSKGIVKKIGYLIIIVVAQLIDNLYINSISVRDTLLYMFITSEIISILENTNDLGIKLPTNIKDKLIKGGENNEQDK